MPPYGAKEHVLAMDPGGRSGWATGWMGRDLLVVGPSGVFRQDTMFTKIAAWQSIGRMDPSARNPDAGPPEFDMIVNESWRPRRINGSMEWIEGDPLLSAQHVGQIRGLAILSGARYIEQSPTLKNTYRASYPEALKDLDRISNEQHDQDARLHLWGYFFTNWFTGSMKKVRILGPDGEPL